MSKCLDTTPVLSGSTPVLSGLGSEGPRQVNYWRYPSGDVSRIIYPNGTNAQRSYTARGQLKKVDWGAGETSYVYHPDGKVNLQTRSNGVRTSYEYNGRGMIWSLRHSNDSSGRDLAKRDYWRDERDRITAWKRGYDQIYNLMENGRGNRYEYDAEGQLTKAWYRANNPETDNPDNPVRGDQFYYDEMGNRKGWNHVANRGQWIVAQRRENRLNQYREWENDIPAPDPRHWGSGIFHDDSIPPPPPPIPPATPAPPHPYVFPGNGVLMQDGWITAGFNALNQPTAMWSKLYQASGTWMYFGYDPLGRCVKRWKSSAAWPPGHNPATYFYYDGWNLVQEGGSNAADAERVYVHGGRIDEIVASWTSGLWHNHHYDAQGNCILLSTTNGVISEQYDYDAFGYPYFYTASGGKGSGKTRFLFTGREWISDLRLYDYRARMYQPELGRFLQPDPLHFGAGDYNLYRYCHNDPVNSSDPFGLEFTPANEFEEVDSIVDAKGKHYFGQTHSKPHISVAVVPTSGGFRPVLKVDVTVTKKLIARTDHGRLRSDRAKDASKVHENKHESQRKEWHDAHQNSAPAGPYPDRQSAEKAGNEARKGLLRDYYKDVREKDRHQPDKQWKDILDKEKRH